MQRAVARQKKVKEATDPVSCYLRPKLSEATVRYLEEYDFQPSAAAVELKEVLVTGLNKIICHTPIEESQHIAKFVRRPRPETQERLASHPQKPQLVWINRELLEDAYRREISRTPRQDPTFSVGDIVNLRLLALRLGNCTDEISDFIASRLPADTRTLLKTYRSSKCEVQLHQVLFKDLNRIICNQALDDAKKFAEVIGDHCLARR